MKSTQRLFALSTLVGIALLGCGGPSSTSTNEPQKTDPGKTAPAKETFTIGFSQVGSESGWRTANTESIRSAAAERGIDLKFADAQQKQENQLKAIKSFIAQKVDVIAFSAVVETGWEPVLREAQKAGIPIICADRRPDAPEDLFATFIGSDFVEEGRRAGDWMAKKMDGKAVIAELTGTVGSDPAIDRKKGFEEVLAKNPGMKIVVSQTGDFTRAKGKEVMEAILKGEHGSSITAVYAHNDDMAIGAIQAIEEAGKKPGTDIIIVSIDGVKDAFIAMKEGKLNCTVECNPLLGPVIMDTAAKLLKGEKVERWIKPEEGVFDMSMAEKELPNRKY